MAIKQLSLIIVICVIHPLRLIRSDEISDLNEACKSITSHSTMTRLKNTLFCDYDNTLIPINDKRKDVPHIELHLWLRQIDFSDWEGKFRISHWLTMKWEDQHLSWEPASYDNIDKLRVTTSEIWMPNLEVYSPGDMSSALITPPGDINCELDSKGTVNCVIPGEFSGIAVSDYTQFPYDVHNCAMEFGSLIYKTRVTDNLVFTNFSIKEMIYFEGNEWKLLDTDGGIDQIPTEGKPLIGKKNNASYYQQMYVDIRIQRHSALWEVSLVIPMVVLMLFALLPLMINPKLMERSFLLVINMGCHFSIFYFLPWYVPPSGDDPPVVVIFYRDSFIILSFLLVQSWLANWMERNNQTPPDWVLSINSKFSLKDESSSTVTPPKPEVSTNGVAETKLTSIEDHVEVEAETSEEPELQPPQKQISDWKLFRKYFDYCTILTIFLVYCAVFVLSNPYFRKLDEKKINRTHTG